MNTLEVDVAVIGAGTAGLAAYRAAVAQGKRTLLIEGGPYGTTCARVGCMPSKLLIAAGEAAHMLQAAPGFGVHPGASPHRRQGGDGTRAARARPLRRLRARQRRRIPAQDKLRGHARFTGPQTLQVDDHTTVHASRIVIATGSTPVRLAQLANGGPGVDHQRRHVRTGTTCRARWR